MELRWIEKKDEFGKWKLQYRVANEREWNNVPRVGTDKECCDWWEDQLKALITPADLYHRKSHFIPKICPACGKKF